MSNKRARDLGLPFDGTPGRYNAITDVPGVEVGFCTIKRGSGDLTVGNGPVLTGVTAILPRGRLEQNLPEQSEQYRVRPVQPGSIGSDQSSLTEPTE